MKTAVVSGKVGRDQISVTGPVNLTIIIHLVGWLRSEILHAWKLRYRK